MAIDVETLDKVTATEIEAMYREGLITARERQEFLVEKANREGQRLQDKEYLPVAVIMQGIKEGQKGWDNLVEAIMHYNDPASGSITNDVGNAIWYHGQAVWGAMQIIMA